MLKISFLRSLSEENVLDFKNHPNAQQLQNTWGGIVRKKRSACQSYTLPCRAQSITVSL